MMMRAGSAGSESSAASVVKQDNVRRQRQGITTVFLV